MIHECSAGNIEIGFKQTLTRTRRSHEYWTGLIEISFQQTPTRWTREYLTSDMKMLTRWIQEYLTGLVEISL